MLMAPGSMYCFDCWTLMARRVWGSGLTAPAQSASKGSVQSHHQASIPWLKRPLLA